MDWRIYHAVNTWTAHHTGVGHAADVLMTICVALLVAGAFAMWFLGWRRGIARWQLAAVTGLASGALGYVVNQVIHAIHDRARPYEAHHGVWHPYASGTDASFPSDHSSAAFGIAFGVFLVDATAGWFFIAAAAVVGIARVVTGAHYPGDVLAGILVGFGCALVVRRLARPVLDRFVLRRS